DLPPPNGYDYNRFAAAHLHLLAPQGTPCPPEIKQWISDEQEHVSYRESLRSLIYLRAGMFERVLEEEPPTSGPDWFLRAMAEQHVGRASDGRESFARGMRWLTRQTKRDRAIGTYGGAVGLLQVEVLRREAERLIFQ
ncbi:MAG: hypothetical protein ACREHD_09720, partial [Pirellulales bacterium]